MPGNSSGRPGRGRPEERGAAMSLATAAEYALLLAAAEPPAGPPAGRSAPARPPVTAAAAGPRPCPGSAHGNAS